VTVTGSVSNVQVEFFGQNIVLRVTGPVNPYCGVTIARSVTALPAVIGPSEVLDVVTIKSGAFRVILGAGLAHLRGSIALQALTVTVVSLVIVPTGGAV
jgi:hypothetical protein